MKKVGIITVHYNLNYGAVLQAYATHRALVKMGVESTIINYINPIAKKSLQIFSTGSMINNIRALLFMKKRIKRCSAFKDFMKKNYRLTEPVFDYRQLNEKIFDFDVYLTGSDQTFNLALSGEIDMRKTYFLPWVKNAKKISYASSMGETTKGLSKNNELWIKNALLEYSNLSVREKAAADYIEKLGVKRPEVVVDPTLLLSKQEWDEIAKPSNYTNDDYILFYSVLSEPWVVERVKEIAKKFNLKVVAPHYQNRYEIGSGFIRAEECGPAEFIDLIKNAKLICTTSFHGTVFSLLYNKPFLSFVFKEGNRIKNLLSMVNAGSRMVRQGENIDLDMLLNDDFEEVNHILASEKTRSIDILKKFIGE